MHYDGVKSLKPTTLDVAVQNQRAFYWSKALHKWEEIIPHIPAFVMAYRKTRHAICLTKIGENNASQTESPRN